MFHACPVLIAAVTLLLLIVYRPAMAQNAGFIQVTDGRFSAQGRPIHFAGTNNYYQMLHRRSGRGTDADEVLDKMAARSMNLLRTWAFQDMAEYNPSCLICAPVRALQGTERPVDFINEDTFRGLDQTLAAADARGIRVILALVNNWDDYGGMKRWTVWRFGTPGHDQFYSDELIREWFMQYISAIINRVNTVHGRRYRDDPAIMAWELANEPRMGSASSAPILNAWIAEMSAYIKSLDPNHLVTTGMEGFYTGANSSKNTDGWMNAYGQDFIANHLHDSIDFATCHLYPENWGWNPVGNTEFALSKARAFLNQRISDCRSILHKPLLVEEFGAPRDNRGRGINSGTTVIRDRFYSEVYLGIPQQSALTGGPCGGTAMWILFDDATANYDDGNGVFVPWDESTDAIITAHAQFMRKLRRGDLDFDEDVDQTDFGLMQACLGANGVPAPPACANAGMDADSDVDQADVETFKKCQSGPDNPADPDCVF